MASFDYTVTTPKNFDEAVEAVLAKTKESRSLPRPGVEDTTAAVDKAILAIVEEAN